MRQLADISHHIAGIVAVETVDGGRFLAPGRLWWLLVVAALAAAYIWSAVRRRAHALRFADGHLLERLGVSSAAWKRHVSAGLLLAGLALLGVGIAQPTSKVKVPKERATIMLAIDTSISMEASDVSPTRIAAAKEAAISFVSQLPDGLNVGLVSFDTGATVRVTPTDAHEKVATAIDGLDLHPGTAIGDAIALSVSTIGDVPDDENGERPPAMIVLLSDGETTIGRATEEGIPIAKEAGIPVHTIAYGTEDGTVEADTNGDAIPETVPVPVDPEALQTLANGTGGTAFTAESASELGSVYEELGRAVGFDIERTDVTWWFAAAGAALTALAAVTSLWWGSRLV